VIYSWASERLPWLLLHPLLPLIALAGLGAEALWQTGRRTRLALGLAAPLLAAALLYGAVEVTYREPADPAEMFVATQTSTDVPAITAAVRRLARRPQTTIEVDASEGAAWPWAWYFRRIPVSYADMSSAGFRPSADVVIATQADAASFSLHGFGRRAFRLREWWVRDYGRLSPSTGWHWFAGRRPWNALGSFEEVMFVRRGSTR
jgi:predicted membrane-bound mannosyltransferase